MKQILISWAQNKIENLSFLKYYKEIVYLEWFVIAGLAGWFAMIFMTILH